MTAAPFSTRLTGNPDVCNAWAFFVSYYLNLVSKILSFKSLSGDKVAYDISTRKYLQARSLRYDCIVYRRQLREFQHADHTTSVLNSPKLEVQRSFYSCCWKCTMQCDKPKLHSTLSGLEEHIVCHASSLQAHTKACQS